MIGDKAQPEADVLFQVADSEGRCFRVCHGISLYRNRFHVNNAASSLLRYSLTILIRNIFRLSKKIWRSSAVPKT
jgi:hypothetical protein